MISPYYLGFLYQGHFGQLSFSLGYIELIVIMCTPFFIWKNSGNKKIKKFAIVLFAIFLGYFLLMQKFSEPLWYIIPFIKNFQFSYRLLGLIIFCLALLAGSMLSQVKSNQLIGFILFLVIISTILNWGNRRTIPSLNENFLLSHVPRSDINFAVMGQAIPKWADRGIIRPWLTTFPKSHLEFIKGAGKIVEEKRSTNQHVYSVVTDSSAMLQENTWFFPGWEVFDGDKKLAITITKGTTPGVMQFPIIPGKHTLIVTFVDTWDRALSQRISIVTLFFLIGITSVIMILKKRKLYV